MGESARGPAGAGGRGATPHSELATATRVDTVGGAREVSIMLLKCLNKPKSTMYKE